jgi:hypothetical protein
MTPVEDMSTTREVARYKGSRPLAKENSSHAERLIMPMWTRTPLQGRGFEHERSA